MSETVVGVWCGDWKTDDARSVASNAKRRVVSCSNVVSTPISARTFDWCDEFRIPAINCERIISSA